MNYISCSGMKLSHIILYILWLTSLNIRTTLSPQAVAINPEHNDLDVNVNV